MEGVAEEEEVDDQLLWNLQILSEVCMIVYLLFFLHVFVYSCLQSFWVITQLPSQEAIFLIAQNIGLTLNRSRHFSCSS